MKLLAALRDAARWLAKVCHLHIWDYDQHTGSKGHIHLRCRCGATKRVPL